MRSDSTLAENTPVFAQCAMLFTDQYGERRIRIFNYSWKVAQNLYSYFKSSDVENVTQLAISVKRQFSIRIPVFMQSLDRCSGFSK